MAKAQPKAPPRFSSTGSPVENDRPLQSIDRRELLIVASTPAAAIGLPETAFAQGGNLTAIEFASLSNAVAGFPPADPSLAADFLEAFSDRTAELVDLLKIVQNAPAREWQDRIDAAGLTPLADALATAWYTGMVGEGSQHRA